MNNLDKTIKTIEALPTAAGLFPFERIDHFGHEGWSAIDGQPIIPVAEIKAIAAEVKRLREGLEHYGSEDNWLCEMCDDPNYNCAPSIHHANIYDKNTHGYDHARKILEGE